MLTYASDYTDSTQGNIDFYKKIWSLQITPKNKIANWRIIHNFIPTASILYNRRLAISPMCPRCNIEAETPLHISTRCGPNEIE